MSKAKVTADAEAQTPAKEAKPSAFVAASIEDAAGEQVDLSDAEDAADDGDTQEPSAQDVAAEGDGQPALDEAEDDSPGKVPLAALKAEKAKRQALEKELETLKASKEEKAPPKKAEPDTHETFTREEIPDPELDPEENGAFYARVIAKSRYNAIEAGIDPIDIQRAEYALQVANAAGQVPAALSAKLDIAKDPIPLVMKWYTDQQSARKSRAALEQLQAHGGDLDALIEAKLAERLAQQPPPAEKTPVKGVAPRLSKPGAVDDTVPMSGFMASTLRG